MTTSGAKVRTAFLVYHWRAESEHRKRESMSGWLKILLAGILPVLAIIEFFFRRPRISGEIIEGAFLSRLGALDATGMEDTEIILKVRIVNKGHTATTVSNWQIEMQIDGKVQAGSSPIPQEFLASRLNPEVKLFSTEIVSQTEWPLDDIAESANKTPLEHARPREGWLRFIVCGAEADKAKSAEMILRYTNGLNKKLEIKHKRHTAWPPEPKIHDTRNVKELMEVQSMSGPKPPLPGHPLRFDS